MVLNITINKEQVYEEVAQTTSYTGAKMEGDSNAYDRIFTTDADRSQLERFWTESCVAVCEKLKKFLGGTETTSTGFSIELDLSSSFDETLSESIQKELVSFFVMNITAKWYVFTNKKESADYALAAASFLEGVHRKSCYKKRPRRPKYGTEQ